METLLDTQRWTGVFLVPGGFNNCFAGELR